MKKRTLNQTWVLCLRMWRWIAKAKAENSRRRVPLLKRRWLNDNGFENLAGDCFFCEYIRGTVGCSGCPGRLVNRSFGCYRDAYHHDNQPIAFYKELLRLNRIRKAKIRK